MKNKNVMLQSHFSKSNTSILTNFLAESFIFFKLISKLSTTLFYRKSDGPILAAALPIIIIIHPNLKDPKKRFVLIKYLVLSVSLIT